MSVPKIAGITVIDCYSIGDIVSNLRKHDLHIRYIHLKTGL